MPDLCEQHEQDSLFFRSWCLTTRNLGIFLLIVLWRESDFDCELDAYMHKPDDK